MTLVNALCLSFLLSSQVLRVTNQVTSTAVTNPGTNPAKQTILAQATTLAQRGAAKYKTKCKEEWKVDFPFIDRGRIDKV
eukprot:m.54290 g.54290  ORF g.54290 m.54290 type:complete len:80 (+) comp34346_c0_seq1:63-302(+)